MELAERTSESVGMPTRSFLKDDACQNELLKEIRRCTMLRHAKPHPRSTAQHPQAYEEMKKVAEVGRGNKASVFVNATADKVEL